MIVSFSKDFCIQLNQSNIGKIMAKFLYTEEQLTYDDVLLYPRKSLNSRNEVVLEYNPIIPAPMSTVSEEELCSAQLNAGGIAILHRYVSLERKISFFNKIILSNANMPDVYDRCFIGVGLEKEEIDKLCRAGVNNFCIDIANGWSDKCIELIKYLKYKAFAKVIAGNIATPEGFEALKNAGADYIRVGIGGGSLCTTRIISGHGFPNFSCIDEIYSQKKCWNTTVKIIADGGIRNSGDCVKALAAGADYCMMGKYFANCKEAPGDIVEKDGQKYKVYAGMASSFVQQKVYGKVIAAPEGVSTLVPLGKSYLESIDLLLKGIKSGCSYSNARSIDELRKNAYFVRVSPATLEENKPHGQSLKFEA